MSDSHRRVGLLALATGLALALVGCTTLPHQGTISTRPATATPTPTQLAIPQSSLPLDCAQLADAPAVSAQYQGDTVKVAVDQSSTASGFLFRAFQQGGGLHCVWGGSGRTDGGYDLGMELFVLTDAASPYAAYAGSSSVAWVADRYGDHSKSFCYVNDAFLQCYGDVLIGQTWLDFRLTDDHHAVTVDQAYAWADEQIRPAVAAISHTGASRPAWVPGSAYDTSKLCDAATATAIAGAPVAVTEPASDPSGHPESVGAGRAPVARCTWTSVAADANVDIAALTGGAWALPGMTANLAEATGLLGGTAQSATIPGADGAFVADGETAWGAVVAHGSLIEVFRDSSQTGNDNVPLMTRIAAYLDAHS